jgi:uncharacterized damage-inducible protein DinB
VISRPESDEFAPYFGRYITEAGSTDPLTTMGKQLETTTTLFAAVGESRAGHRYAPGKWSIREMLGHLADSERIFSYRALRLARADATPLPGFDENDFVAAAEFDSRPLASLLEEWRSVRRASLTLFENLSDDALRRRGTVSDGPMSVRALAWIIAGHELHHLAVLRERYGVGGAA